MRLAAFQNPEFHKAQAMRLSTFDKPRIISCAEEFPRHVALPRGCLEDVRAFFDAHSVEIETRDERNLGEEIEVAFQGRLRPEQEELASILSGSDMGILSVPTGFGKTVLAIWLIAHRKVNTLILVHRISLLEQWCEQLSLFLGIETKAIGLIGGGKKRTTGKVDVAVIQSLQKKGVVNDIVAQYGQVIVDECHHLSAFTFERVMREAKARYVLGLTATPMRKDGHHPIIFMQCGPIIAQIRSRNAEMHGTFSRRVLFRKTAFGMPESKEEWTIQDIYRSMIQDADRNGQIINDVMHALSERRSPLVLTERVDHLNVLARSLEGKTPNVFILRGGMGKKQRRSTFEKLHSLNDTDPCVILATGRFAGEGFDFPRLDSLFLAMPISWRGTLQQYVGRLHRTYTGKKDLYVFDYVDQNIPMLQRMLTKRKKGYRAMGYETELQMDLAFEHNQT